MPLIPATQADLLALWRAILPRSYTLPIETEGGGEGFDLPASHARIWERVEGAANTSQQAYYLRLHSTQTGLTASGPRKATGTVELRRAAPALGDLVLPAGTVFEGHATDSYGGDLFIGRWLAVEAVTLPEGNGGPILVPVEAEFQGYTGNQGATGITILGALGRLEVPAVVASLTGFERVTTLADNQTASRFSAGLVGRYVRLVDGSVPLVSENRFDPRRVVSTYTDGGGLVAIMVDLALDNAADVGKAVTVEVEEWEDLGVTVTQPLPIEGGMPDALGAIGVDRNLGRTPDESDENYRRRLQTLADIITPASHVRILDRILGPLGIAYEYQETGTLDELMGFTWGVHFWGVGQVEFLTKLPGSELIGQGIVWLPAAKHVRFFQVVVHRSSLGEYGFFWGEPDSPSFWSVGFWGGSPLGFNAVLAQLWAELNAARAAGVAFLILLID